MPERSRPRKKPSFETTVRPIILNTIHDALEKHFKQMDKTFGDPEANLSITEIEDLRLSIESARDSIFIALYLFNVQQNHVQNCVGQFSDKMFINLKKSVSDTFTYGDGRSTKFHEAALNSALIFGLTSFEMSRAILSGTPEKARKAIFDYILKEPFYNSTLSLVDIEELTNEFPFSPTNPET